VTPVHNTVALCLGLVATVIGLFVYSVLRTSVASADQLRDMGVFILPQAREIAPFELTLHTGAVFDLDSLENRWSFLFFGFTNCPDLCPTALAAMVQAERRLLELDAHPAARLQSVFVSVDPERDHTDQLAAYVGAFSPNLLGATGSVAALAALAAQLHVAFAKVPAANAVATAGPNAVVEPAGEAVAKPPGEPIGEPTGAYQVDHSANIVIVNPKGHYHGFIKFPQQADTIVATFQSLAANF